MSQQTHSRLVAFIWRIADDCLRDVYVRGKYRDVILPMVVLRRLDTLLEDSKEKVLKEVRFQKEQMKTHDPDEDALKHARSEERRVGKERTRRTEARRWRRKEKRR